MPKPKLTYFDLEGRAGVPRMMLHLAGIDFEDYRLKEGEFDKFKADNVNGSGRLFGSVPVYFDGSLRLAESGAIAAYANDKLHPDLSPEQRAVDLMYWGCYYDITTAVYKTMFGGDDKSKAEAKEELQKVAKKFLQPWEERLLPESGFVHGKEKPSLADVAVYDALYAPSQGLKAAGIDLTPYKRVLKLCEAVAAVPSLAAYIPTRK